jgi:sugar phosphate isomerase/epimerase
MQLQLFRTLWGHGDDIHRSAAEAAAAGFSGLEGGLPGAPKARRDLAQALADSGLDIIGEICTGGEGDEWWIPRREASVKDHLATLEQGLQNWDESGFAPRFINCMAGLDAWTLSQSVEFFGAAMALGAQFGRTLSFETHRSRAFYAPWTTLAVVRELPEIKITADFSHWCVVAERLIDTEEEALEVVTPRVHHIQARVGYPQGPQVPHPAAPEYRECLEAHQRWWERIWQSQVMRGYQVSTMTPEFGPNGYLQTLPFTGRPVADLWSLNLWMGQTERAHFESAIGAPATPFANTSRSLESSLHP